MSKSNETPEEKLQRLRAMSDREFARSFVAWVQGGANSPEEVEEFYRQRAIREAAYFRQLLRGHGMYPTHDLAADARPADVRDYRRMLRQAARGLNVNDVLALSLLAARLKAGGAPGKELFS